MVSVSLVVDQCLLQCIRWLMGYYRNFADQISSQKDDHFLFNFDALDVFVK